MTWTSSFCNAGTSCVWSVTIRKISLSRLGLVAPYHFGFGVSVIEASFVYPVILYGPPESVGRFLSNQVIDAARPVGVPSSPCCSAMCAGYIVANMAFQSANGFDITTVTVLPLSDPVSDLIWS